MSQNFLPFALTVRDLLTEHLVQRRWMGLDLGPELGGCGDRSYARIWINAGLIMIMKVAICSPSHGELASSTLTRLYPLKCW